MFRGWLRLELDRMTVPLFATIHASKFSIAVPFLEVPYIFFVTSDFVGFLLIRDARKKNVTFRYT